MVAATAELLGQRFGALIVLAKVGRTPVNPPRSIWLCRCDCGTERKLLTGQLRKGTAADCGNHPQPLPSGPSLSAAELGWAAGLFEGEGSVRISKPARRNQGSLHVDVVNTDEALVYWFHARWPGAITRGSLAGNRRPYCRWRAAALQAACFLTAIEPYLQGAKRERVQLALEFQAQKRTSSVWNRDAAYLARQGEFYERLKKMNIRGALQGSQLLLLAEPRRAKETQASEQVSLKGNPHDRSRKPRHLRAVRPRPRGRHH